MLRVLPSGMITLVSENARVLVVDDDPKFRNFAVQGLDESGYSARAAGGVREARELLAEHPIDIVLLDVTMPELDGHELLRGMREAGLDIPVIFVTARGVTSERVEGLRRGADDYVVKPVPFAELLARIEAVLRRHRRLPILRFGALSIDIASRRVECQGAELALSLKEFDLLTCLVQAGGVLRTRAELLRDVWGIHHDPGTNVVDVHVGRIRRKLAGCDCPRIETVRGRGYRIVIQAP